ncbi:MAG: hypothetical protein ACRDB9_08985 [Cetobacterium sp.]
MAKYTIELHTLLKDSTFKLFDFDYDFYTDNNGIRNNFEEKFIQHYRFSEIGFESVARFKHMLKSKLDLLMPYYKQLYLSELKAKDIEFLLNKDYTETFERELTGISNSDVSNKANETNNIDTISSANNTSKSSDINNGISDVNLETGLTSTNNINDSSNNNTKGSIKSDSDSTSTSNNEMNEKTTLVGKGNIGTTSSAELLDKWRATMINIDKQIIDECYILFMQIF